MPLVGQGSVNSPIVVSDDEEEACVLELVDVDLADRLSSPSPQQIIYDRLSPPDWDKPADRQLQLNDRQHADYGDEFSDHHGVGYPRLGQKRGWGSITSGDISQYPQRKRSANMMSHLSNANHPPLLHLNPPMESRAARKKRKKRERLAGEADTRTNASASAAAPSARPMAQTFQIPSFAPTSTSLSSSRPTRPLPHVPPSRRPSLPLPAKPPTALPPALPFQSESLASSMVYSPVNIPPLSAPYLLPTPSLHPLPPIPAQQPPAPLYNPIYVAPLPPKPQEAPMQPPAPPTDSPPSLSPPPLPALPKKQIGMSSETDLSGRRGTFALPKGSSFPDPSRTLVMELMPKKFRTPTFVRKWAMSFGSHPRGSPPRIDLDARAGKALIEFANPDLASLGWASPRLAIGEGKEHIRVWWYRPDSLGGNRPELEEGEIEEMDVGQQPTIMNGTPAGKKDKGKGKQRENKPQQSSSVQGRSGRAAPERAVDHSKGQGSLAQNTVYSGLPLEDALRDIKEAPPPGSSASIGAAWLDSQVLPAVSSASPLVPVYVGYNGDTEEAMDLSSEDDQVGFRPKHFERRMNGFPCPGSSKQDDTESILSSRVESPEPSAPLGQSVRYDQAEKGLLAPRVSSTFTSAPFALRAPAPRKANTYSSPFPLPRDQEEYASHPSSLSASVASLPPSENFSMSLISSVTSVSSVATPPPQTPVDTPSHWKSRSAMRTPTPPPEPRKEQTTPKVPSQTAHFTAPGTRRKDLEERLARSKELAFRNASGRPETPNHNGVDSSTSFSNRPIISIPRSASPLSFFPRNADEETLRRRVLDTKRSRTMPTFTTPNGLGSGERPPSSAELNKGDVALPAGISDAPTLAEAISTSMSTPISTSGVTPSTASGPSTDISSSAASTPTQATVISRDAHLMTLHSVTQSAVNLEALADSFISETIRTVAPSSRSPIPSWSTPSPFQQKDILAKKQELVDQHIAESKSLMAKMSAAKTKAERSALSAQFKECTRHHEEEAKKLDDMLSNDSMMFPQRTQKLNIYGHSYRQSGRMYGLGFRWPETRPGDMVFDVTDDEDEEDDE